MFEESGTNSNRRKISKKKKRLYSVLSVAGLLIVAFVFGTIYDQIERRIQNWQHERKYADGLVFKQLDESVYGKGGKSEDKAVVAYFDTRLHVDNLYVGKTVKKTIEVGNGSNYPTKLKFEVDGPVSVKIDEEKAGGTEVIIPPHKKGHIPIVITAPKKAFDEPVVTILKLGQEALQEEQNLAQKMLPGAEIPIYTPHIAPPFKPLEIFSEQEFNSMTREERLLYGLPKDFTYEDIPKGTYVGLKAKMNFYYSTLLFHTYGYINYMMIAVGMFIIVILIYFIMRKVGKKKNEKKIEQDFEKTLGF